jgi:K+-sensing histidine kinase KdpD
MEIDRLSRELHTLSEVAKTLIKPLELPELLDDILTNLIGTLAPAEIGAVMLWDQSEGLFRPSAAFGYDFELLKEIGLKKGESVTGKVYEECRACLWENPDSVGRAMKDMHPDNRNIMARSLGSQELPICTLACPITVEENKFGVLVLETLVGPTVFTEEDIPFVQSLADLIALAIDRVRLIEKAEAAREARESDHMRSELTATLSHELRLPLSAIKGYSTALLMPEVGWNEDKQKEFLTLIVEECEHMEGMLTDILDSSLIAMNQLSIQPEPIRLHHTAREVSHEMQLRTDNHNIVVDLSPALPLVSADQRWIKQVFRNILDNAIKYSPSGGLIVIRGRARSADVVVSIADQGVGISPEDVIPLFEKYLRIRTSNRVHVPGTGLGLPFSRAIVEAHGGQIWAEGKQDQGTTMNFTLPIWVISE